MRDGSGCPQQRTGLWASTGIERTAARMEGAIGSRVYRGGSHLDQRDDKMFIITRIE